ncbi:MAG: phasin family protein [Burkholderiales bacterium]|nr:phasin family protein [Burkholderiales bacterium]
MQTRSTPIGDAVFNASRQVWLASLGAAVVSREWAQAEGSSMFRTLVKEGTAVESRTIRMVGHTLEDSFTKANSLWKQARSTVSSTVRQAADTAVTLVQTNLPKSLPKVTLPAMLKPVPATKAKTAAKKRVGQAKRGTKARGAKPVKRGARKVKAATKK